MKKNIIIFLGFILCSNFLFAQSVGIGTLSPNASAQLDVSSSNKGLLMPRMTLAQRNAIATPALGLLVFDTDKRVIYMFNGNIWQPLMFTTSENNLPPSPVNANDGASFDYLGASVSISGDYAIAGAYLADVGGNTDQGAAYIFYRSGGVWTQQAKLVPSDGASFDYFGYSVSISGDYAVVGAIYADVAGNGNQGAAYVFTRSGTIWTQQAKLTASDGAASDYFANSVCISGDNIIVGASMDDWGANTNQGSAYIYSRSGTSWTEQAHFSQGVASDFFGCSVSISGSDAVIGAYGWDRSGANIDIGVIYIYHFNGTSWVYLTYLWDISGNNYDYFGYSVSISGAYIISGEYGVDVGSNTDQGSAVIFHRLGSTWAFSDLSSANKITAADGTANDRYGFSVSISGDYALVGASQKNENAIIKQGAGYLYKRNGSSWDIIRKIDDGNGQLNGYFSNGVGIDGWNLIIGAYGKNNYRGEVNFLNFQ